MSIVTKHFQHIFEDAKSRYKELQNVDIDLRYNNGWFFTMRAGVVLGSFFNKPRKYFVSVNLNRKDVLADLSSDDLVARFGHELAHIIDYETMSNLELFTFILKYIFNFRFRFSVERRINTFASSNGFAKESFQAWKNLLSSNKVARSYKEYIIKHYRPSWEDIKESAKLEGISKETYESFR